MSRLLKLRSLSEEEEKQIGQLASSTRWSKSYTVIRADNHLFTIRPMVDNRGQP
jgi:hypothetical protein